jgi:hypothetical protein
MSVSLFEHRPAICPFGHELKPGCITVGWNPCICAMRRKLRSADAELVT